MITEEERRARINYLRTDLSVWEERRRRARFSLALDRLYNCSAMDEALGQMLSELKRLESLETKEPVPFGKRRPREA